MRKVGLYIRVSTEEQAKLQEGSLVSQRQRLEEYVRARNLVESGWGKVVAAYVDEAKSGKDTNRPQYQEMLRDIEKRKIDTILVTELSRFSRSIKDFCAFWDHLKANKAQFLSLREQFDTTTAAGEMMMFSIMNFAQFERKNTSERVSANFQARAMRGLYNGGFAPIGFEPNPVKRGTLSINEEEAAQVRRIFQIFRERGSVAGTLEQLKIEGLKTKVRTKKDGNVVGGREWTFNALWHVLRNKHYMGDREIHKKHRYLHPDQVPKGKEYTTVKASWGAIVSRELFETVQEQLSSNFAKYKPADRGVFDYLFTSTVFCTECGEDLIGRSGKSQNGTKYTYYCHRKKATECKIIRIDALELHNILRERLKLLAQRSALIEQLYKDADVNEEAILPDNERRASFLENKIKDLKKQEANLSDQVANYGGSQVIAKKLALVEAEIETLSRELEVLKSDVDFSKDNVVNAKELFEFAKNFNKHFSRLTPAERKQCIRLFFGRIEVQPKVLNVRYNYEKDFIYSAGQVLRQATHANSKGDGPSGPSSSLIFANFVTTHKSLRTHMNGAEGENRTRTPV